MTRHRPGGRALAAVVAIGVLGWSGRWLHLERRTWEARTEAAAALARGDFDAARAGFEAVLERWPGDDEAAYQLGLCELAAGRLEPALRAFERVGDRSARADLAAVKMAPILLERGAFDRAEERLRGALRHSGPHAAEARALLVRVLRFEDRRDEARTLLRQELAQASDPVRVLRDLWLLDSEAIALDRTAEMFERAVRAVPDDDRAWLGLANLDRRAGRLDAAADRLGRCLDRRPDDPAVWRAWLEWAIAAGRPAEARRALGHLPPDRIERPELLAWQAWFAAQRDDPEAEARALEELTALDPAAPGALDRLAVLAARRGEPERAGELRRRKAEIDAARDRYRRLFERADADLSADSRTMAGLAETLGRPVEARGWWALRRRQDPGDAEARAALARLDRVDRREGVADRLAALLIDPEPRAAVAPGPADPPTPRFVEAADRAGLRFAFDHGPTPDRQLPETMSGGVGLLDFDGDGWLDVYCVQGGPFPPDPSRPSTGDRLFRNNGDGTFADVSEPSGIAAMPRGYGHGVAVGDYDNDGHADLFLTRFGSYALYRNNGDGTFADATGPAGLGGDRGWPTSAAFADLDGDGDLDLYVCQYLRWDPAAPERCVDPESGRPTYCEPRTLEAEPDRLFRNDGGRFVEVAAQAGAVDPDGRGLGVVAVDLDDDGRIDLFVANDTTANLAFFNRGGLRFEDAGLESGLATNAVSGFLAGMGVACGDLDRDGRPDLAVTNFYNESTTYYQNLGGGLFADRTSAVGLAAPSRYRLGFGVAFLDVNNDGCLDMATANGMVNDSRPLYPYAMPAQLLLGDDSGRLVDATDRAGPPWTTPRIGRGLATGDLDNDGRLDLLVVGQGEPLAYFRNQSEGGHFLTILLEGSASGRDAVGARVVVEAGGRRQAAWRFGGGSYLSASDPRLHFGLGGARRADRVEVRWPSGRVDTFEGLAAGAGYRLREGQPGPSPLEGFHPAR